MRGRSSGKTAPPATRASPGKAGGLIYTIATERHCSDDLTPDRWPHPDLSSTTPYPGPSIRY